MKHLKLNRPIVFIDVEATALARALNVSVAWLFEETEAYQS